jgi:hypothetical protein
MSYNFVLNSSNNVSIYNNQYKFNFINGQFDIPEGSEMCINTLVMPYSFYNITSFLGNNIFYWTYPVATTSFTISATNSTTITVSAATGASNLAVGSIITCSQNPSSTSPTGLIYITALGSGSGGNGTYTVSQLVTYVSPSASSTGIVRTITLKDGFYQLSDIQNSLWSDMKTAGVYFYNNNPNQSASNSVGSSNSNFIFPISLSVTPSYYTNSVTFQYIPTTSGNVTTQLGQNWTYAGASYPATASTCQLIIPTGVTNTTTNNIGNIIGFLSGAFPSTIQTYSGTPTISNSSLYTVLGNTITGYNPPFPAQGSFVNAIVIRCNLVDNPISSVNDILDTTTINTTFGSNIVYQPVSDNWVKIKKGTYSSLTISFSDQNFNTLYMNDPNILLSLLIRFPKKI